MLRILLIFGGGGLGATLRYLVQGWVQRWWGATFPMGTLVVNISGCLVMGFLGGLFFGAWPINEDLRFGILVGILGGYTTFSSFGWDALQLSSDREFLAAAGYVLLSVAIGLVAVWLGKQVSQLIYGIA